MTVVNYSVQDIFGNNQFFWVGHRLVPARCCSSDRLHERARCRQHRCSRRSSSLIEIPLGIVVALCDAAAAAAGPRSRSCVMALPLLIPWNVVGTIWQIFGRADIGLLGRAINALGIDYNYTSDVRRRLDHRLVMDVWHWTPLVALLCYAGLQSIPRRLLPGGAHRRRLALGGVPLHPAAEDARRAADRGAAALHGQLHDLHRAVRAHRRRPRQRDDLPVDRPRRRSRVGQFDLGPAAAFSIVYFLSSCSSATSSTR